MSPSRQFPKNPLRDRPDPFRDSPGGNPFSDGPSPTTPADANPYASTAQGAANESALGPVSASANLDAPVYVAWLPSRGKSILAYALVGVALAVPGAFLCGPAVLGCLALTATAFVMARGDLAAMKAGAMDSRGRKKTIAGMWIGGIGSLAIFGVALAQMRLLIPQLLEEL